MLSDGDPRQIRKRIFICACVPAIDLFDDILIHRKRLIYELRTNHIQELRSPGHSPDTLLRSQSLGPENHHSPHIWRLLRD
jgi:hypothetical protein